MLYDPSLTDQTNVIKLINLKIKLTGQVIMLGKFKNKVSVV